jgi:hypothetical protein
LCAGAICDAVRVARPLAVAETVGGQDNQIAVLRIRQGGENTLQLTVYRVDDLAGTIDGLAPGDAAYAAAAQARAYIMASGDTSIVGPGYGQFAQTLLTGIDAGDIIAIRRRLLGLRQRQRECRRRLRQPPVELRPQHLGLGRHLCRRRPGLQRHDRAVRLHQLLRPRLARVASRSRLQSIAMAGRVDLVESRPPPTGNRSLMA